MKPVTKLIIGLVCCLVYSFSIAQQLPSESVAKIDQLIKKYGEATPGASVLVSRGGKVVYERYVGMADLEHGIPVGPETVFEAGSVSKQFTAACLLMLVQEGKISLDDEIQKFVPEVPVYDRPITVLHLIQHTSGLKDWGSLAGLGGWSRGTRVYTNDIALNYIARQPDLNYLPGDEYLYSNSNYTLMTIIVERVSGQKLAAFTADRIFKPLGMSQSSWRTNYRDIVPNRAIGYAFQSQKYYMDMPFENTYGHAALLTTVRDLNIWNLSWYKASADQALRDLRERRGILTNRDTIAYAGGVRIDFHNGKKSVNHSGATAGYRAWLSYFPSDELSIVFLSNDASAKTTGTGEGIADIVLGPKNRPAAETTPDKATKEYTLNKEQIEHLVGLYHSEAVEGTWEITNQNGQLGVRVLPHNQVHKLTPVEEGFFTGSGLGNIRVDKHANGQVSGFKVSIDRARNVWFKKN